jgi:hypothetical protein
MQYKKSYLIILFILGVGLTGLYAQEVIPASGGDATGSGGTSSYSIGQIVYTTHNGTNGSAAQGVQQPYEISVVTGLEEVDGITLQSKTYPNPASSYITLKVDNNDLQNLSYQLFDMNGRLLDNKIIIDPETRFDLNNMVSGTYFLKLIQNNKEIKNFKIIKQQ